MKPIMRLGFCSLVFALLMPMQGWAAEPVVAVSGEVQTPLKLTLADLKALPITKLRATDHDGRAAEYEGVALSEILRKAGVPQGETLRGGALQLCLLVKAADGYKVVFSLAELDPLSTNKQTILAFRRDGTDLGVETGPFRVIVSDEKRQSRWVRKVTELDVVRVGAAEKRP